MFLPGRLSRTTLGDILGAAHREGITGILQLSELEGPTAGRRHRIHLSQGLVTDVETSLTVDEQAMNQTPLDRLFELREAQLSFHVPRRRFGRAGRPLSPERVLFGRRRARDAKDTNEPPRGVPIERDVALAQLGLGPKATPSQIKAAFRLRAAELHPDRHPRASYAERASLIRQFARLSQAYHSLINRAAA